MTRPELAIDANGQPIQVPADATGMRARRIGGGPGRPELVCDAFGRPVLFPIDATFEDVYRAGGPGKYKMIFVNAAGFMLEDGPFGMTGMMQPQPLRNAGADGDLATTIVGTPGSSFQPRDFRDELLFHLITKQTQITEAVIRGVPAWMQASADLVNAADNAKLTTRPPPVLAPAPVEEPEVAPEPEPPPPSRLPGWLKEALDTCVKSIAAQLGERVAGKLGGMPLESLFDWSKAAPKPPAAADMPSPMAYTTAAATPPVPAAPAMDPRWFHAASGGIPMDPTWYTPASTDVTPAASAWPATAPVEHVPMDPAWFTPAPSDSMRPEATWDAAVASSSPRAHVSQFTASPTGAPIDLAWYAAGAPGDGTQSTAIASAPMTGATSTDPAWYGAVAPELHAPSTRLASAPTTGAPMAGAPMTGAPMADAPPGAAIATPSAATTPLGVTDLGDGIARPPMPNTLTPPSISTAPAEPGAVPADTVEPPIAVRVAPPHLPTPIRPSSSASAHGALAGATSPDAPWSLVARGNPAPADGNAPTQLRSARAPRAAPPATALARRGAMFPTALPPTPLVGGAAPPQMIAAPPTRPRAATADSIALPSYIMEIYTALTPQEQERTQQLVAMLTQEERVQWLIELGALGLPDAIARVRDLIHPHPRAAR